MPICRTILRNVTQADVQNGVIREALPRASVGKRSKKELIAEQRRKQSAAVPGNDHRPALATTSGSH
jgi:hypothetical protein